MRILDALQTGGLCPASWTQADGTIDVEAALRPGSVLGHYRIQRELGSGAFGSVFAAEDLNLQRDVALKVMRDVLHESRESLLSEARMAASLNHPNVCTVYSVEEIDGVPAIAMEYINGPSLAKLIAVGLDPGRIRDLALGIAQGLAAAHSLQIVHSDLKPLNILIAEDGTPKILDFGLARMRTIRPPSPKPSEIAGGVLNDADLEETVDFSTSPARREPDPAKHAGSTSDSVRVGTSSSSFTLRGTPAYMTPEHSTGQTIGEASDVFALGLILFEMVTGRKALADSSVVSVLNTLQDDDLSGRLSRKLDEPYQSLVRKMLDKSPERRPTAAQVAERLGE